VTRSIHLVFGDVSSYGGIQRYNRQLIRAAHQVVGEDGQVRVLSLNDGTGAHPIRGFERRQRALVRHAITLARAERPDVIVLGHIHFAPLALTLRAVSPRTRLYAVAHGKEVEKRLSPLVLAGIELCHGVFAVSQSTADLLRRVQGVKRAKLYLLFYGFDARAGSESRRTRGDDRHVRLLSVARLDSGDSYKGIDVTIRAMARAGQAEPGLRYSIVGDGDDMPRLRALSHTLGVARQVHFAGNVCDDELDRLYDACDVFVLPSTREGLGIVYLEAMARGKPVIGVHAGGVADVVVHEANGLLVNRPDPDAVAAAIIRLAADEELRTRLGAFGRDRTVPCFSLERMSQQLLWALDGASVCRPTGPQGHGHDGYTALPEAGVRS